MRLAVISDIHGNMEAFHQVLTDIDKSGIDAIFCLGDIVGYGPEPDAAVKQVQERNIPTIMGNHELAVANPKILELFNPLARLSLQKTIQLLSEPSIQFVCELNSFITSNDCRFVHGFPPDSITTYLFQASEEQLQRSFEQMSETICFLGHTHTPEIIVFDGQHITRGPLYEGITKLNKECRYIINTGSVGQPRDDNNNAKYVIWDSAKLNLEVRYVPYDISTVVNKILEAGLPEAHAKRLW
jgi:predicted phosphodiesterase